MAQTLLDLHLHYTYAMSLTTISWLVDVTIKNIVLATSYDKIGPNATFHIWVMVFVMDMMGLRFIFNILILFQACARLPEFRGYRSRRFPGQPAPALPKIVPRRLQLPATFAQDMEWTRIGARRTRFLDLGQPKSQNLGYQTLVNLKRSILYRY